MIQFNSSMPNCYIVYRLSKKFQLIMTVMLIFLLIGICTAEKIVTSKVFVIPIGPETFNWTSDGIFSFHHQFFVIYNFNLCL